MTNPSEFFLKACRLQNLPSRQRRREGEAPSGSAGGGGDASPYNIDRPPVWLMRQAGRALPEYRALRTKHDFLEMLTTEELIIEISLQPWRRFKMDAVIVFADILLLPWKMGMDLKFVEGQGPKFSKRLADREDLENLKTIHPFDTFPFLLKALKQIKKEIGSNAALLGFAGSPWTVASYIMDVTTPDTFLKKVLERLTQETILYLKAQVEAGVEAIQIFDSWGGALSPKEYAVWSAPYIKEIVDALRPCGVPIILFVRESQNLLEPMLQTGCDVLSVGWKTPLAKARKSGAGKVALQGNFNPHILLSATPEEIRRETQSMLKAMEGYAGYIANLGHGVLPKTPLENIAAFVETVKATK